MRQRFITAGESRKSRRSCQKGRSSRDLDVFRCEGLRKNKMGSGSKRALASDRDFKAWVETAKSAFASDNPNPERKGCPEANQLRNLAFRRIRDQRAVEITLHLRKCSECFRELGSHMEQFYHRRRMRRLSIALAATLLIAAGMAAFALKHGCWRQHRPELAERDTRPVQSPEQTLVQRPTEVAKTDSPLPVVDYFVVSLMRGAKPPQSEILTLKGERQCLRIHLPLGSDPGEYEVRLHRKADKKEVLKTYGKAAKGNGYILAFEEDFGKLPPGSYLLAIFPPGWKGEVQAHSVEIVGIRGN